jgi:hypothetical protein
MNGVASGMTMWPDEITVTLLGDSISVRAGDPRKKYD